MRKIVLGTDQALSSIILCTVVSIENNLCVCQPLDEGEATIDNVLITAKPGETNFIITPAIDSTVAVAMFDDTDNSEAMIVMFSEIQTIQIRGDQFGGLTKSPELKTQLDKNNEILQALLDILTGSPINEPGNGAPSALQAALSAVLVGKPIGNFSDIENVNVKHG